MLVINTKLASIFLCICFGCILVSGFNEMKSDFDYSEIRWGFSGNIAFKFCYSCGYKKAFEDYVPLLIKRYPQLLINGSNYDPSAINLYLSKFILLFKILLIILIISSYDIFRTFGRQQPSWWPYLMDNKVYACMMIFFVGNMLESQLISSGAFEITLNGVPVWSKIQSGRIPAPQELFQIIDNQMQFGVNFKANSKDL